MEYEASYFENEIREGFFIPGMVKRSWAAQLQILETVSEICNRHNISWFADCGTLIGAIRHGGFIPWDDDLDICMLRDDYIRFNEVVGSEVPKGYTVLNLDNELGYGNFITRITNSHEIHLDSEYLQAHHGFPYVAGIDIFPLDYLYTDEEQEEARRIKAKNLWEFAQRVKDGKEIKSSAQVIEYVEELLGYKVNRDIPVEAMMVRELEKLFKQCPKEGATHVALMPFWAQHKNHKYPLEYYKTYVLMPFENSQIRVPVAYNEVLKIEYGQWERVNRKGGIHDYPFYSDQERILYENQGAIPYRYIFSERNHCNFEARKQHAMAVDPNRQRLHLMAEAQNLIFRSIDGKENQVSLQLLAKCQEMAIAIGEEVDAKQEDAGELIPLLEAYCEQIYELYQKVSSNSRVNTFQEKKKLDKACDILKKRYEQEVHAKREILFLPVRYRDWKRMEPFYKELVKEAENDVKVMPIPFAERLDDGRMGQEFYEGELFAREVEIIDYQCYDFNTNHPDVIYIQNPWDEYCSGMTVEPSFYASKLCEMTEELVYIPNFEVDEIDPEDEKSIANLSLYAVTPGVVYADETIVASENTKKYYVEALVNATGVSWKEYWQKKICVKEIFNEQVTEKTTEHKKVIAFYTGTSDYYVYGQQTLEKLQNVIDTFKENKDRITIRWFMEESFQENLASINPMTSDKFHQVLLKFTEEGLGEVVSTKEASEKIKECDAFYGAAGYVMNLAIQKKIPVMMWKI